MKIYYENAECDNCGYKRLVKENGEQLLAGDWYHDHISQRIEGYIQALEDFGIEFELEERKIDCPYDCRGDE